MLLWHLIALLSWCIRLLITQSWTLTLLQRNESRNWRKRTRNWSRSSMAWARTSWVSWSAVESASMRPKVPRVSAREHAARAPNGAAHRHRSGPSRSATTPITNPAAVFISGVFNANRAAFRPVSAGTLQCWPMRPSSWQTCRWHAECRLILTLICISSWLNAQTWGSDLTSVTLQQWN